MAENITYNRPGPKHTNTTNTNTYWPILLSFKIMYKLYYKKNIFFIYALTAPNKFQYYEWKKTQQQILSTTWQTDDGGGGGMMLL